MDAIDENKDESKEPDDKPESLYHSLDDLIVLWEERLSKGGSDNEIISQPKKSSVDFHGDTRHSTDIDDPPAIVSTASSDSDETRDGPPSPSHNIFTMFQPFVSPGREPGSAVTQLQESKRMIEERDQKIESLEAVIHSDIEIIKKMKSTIEKMVDTRIAEGKSRPATRKTIPEELEYTLALQENQNEVLEEQCTSFQDTIKGLEAKNSSQENVIEFLKSQLVTLLVTKRMVEEELGSELENRDTVMANLETSFKENAKQSQRMIMDLGSRNSSLEDQIEGLKAENVRLRLTSQIMEEEKRMSEQAMQTEMQLFYIENNRHEIL